MLHAKKKSFQNVAYKKKIISTSHLYQSSNKPSIQIIAANQTWAQHKIYP
jgi:hypothetical protein